MLSHFAPLSDLVDERSYVKRRRVYATNGCGNSSGRSDALYDRFALTIFTYLSQQVSNEQDAEDLLLEVFLVACNNQASDGNPSARIVWSVF
jgi:hypothetical protein